MDALFCPSLSVSLSLSLSLFVPVSLSVCLYANCKNALCIWDCITRFWWQLTCNCENTKLILQSRMISLTLLRLSDTPETPPQGGLPPQIYSISPTPGSARLLYAAYTERYRCPERYRCTKTWLKGWCGRFAARPKLRSKILRSRENF